MAGLWAGGWGLIACERSCFAAWQFWQGCVCVLPSSLHGGNLPLGGAGIRNATVCLALRGTELDLNVLFKSWIFRLSFPTCLGRWRELRFPSTLQFHYLYLRHVFSSFLSVVVFSKCILFYFLSLSPSSLYPGPLTSHTPQRKSSSRPSARSHVQCQRHPSQDVTCLSPLLPPGLLEKWNSPVWGKGNWVRTFPEASRV